VVTIPKDKIKVKSPDTASPGGDKKEESPEKNQDTSTDLPLELKRKSSIRSLNKNL
jgi:hypothetical protein